MKKFEVHVYMEVSSTDSVRLELFIFADNTEDAERGIKHLYRLDDAHSVYVWEADQ